MIALGLLALGLRPPDRLELDVVLEGRAAGGVVRANLTPLHPGGDFLRPPSAWRQRACRVADRSCRITFRWWRRERPLLPQDHALALTYEQGGREIPLGEARLAAPRWSGVVRVVCSSAGRCEEV